MEQNARVAEEQVTERRARILGLEYFDTSGTSEKQLIKDLLSVPEMYSMKLVPLSINNDAVNFGVTNSTPSTVAIAIRQRFLEQRVNFFLISDAGYRDYMRLFDPPKSVTYQNIALGTTNPDDQVKQISAVLSQVRADDMLAYLVQQAHQLGASDIHVEVENNYTRVRFRIDGVLHRIAELPLDKYRLLIAAIASAGNVSTSSDEAQQGHIAQKVKMADGNEVDVNVRLETVPGINGMEVVMRLFNMDQNMYNLDRLGLSAQERAVVDDIIARPTGLVMVVGPTGSGKTTTLYSMLNSLSSEERKIITIEDPVEYQFEGITQISITSKSNAETSFANKLRAVLRLDPDIVMVGEIRDMDTAKTALQAALTGHLVLSTFHASSAAAALTRLVDIIGQNPLYASAVRLVMAQRLVRKLDDATKQPYQPDEATLKRIHEIIDRLPAHVERPDVTNLTLYTPGTSPDNPYGYKGQIALREQFTMTEPVVKLMTSGKIISAQEIEDSAIAGGMRTMLQDGLLKAIAGETTLEELYRTIG